MRRPHFPCSHPVFRDLYLRVRTQRSKQAVEVLGTNDLRHLLAQDFLLLLGHVRGHPGCTAFKTTSA